MFSLHELHIYLRKRGAAEECRLRHEQLQKAWSQHKKLSGQRGLLQVSKTPRIREHTLICSW